MAKIKIPKIKPPREACSRCREWVDEKDCGPNDIPHCVQDNDFYARAFMLGRVLMCPKFNEE